jgi:ABC-type dipeptide/oligopeptide/nickel transport system ATPase component
MIAQQASSAGEYVLRIKDLRVSFHTYLGEVKALDGIDLAIRKGEIIGLVGESGCGKSVTALSIAGLLPQNARVVSGEIWLTDKNLRKMGKDDMRRARLHDLAIVFQDPMTYLNPVMSIGSQITEILLEETRLYREDLLRSRLREIEASEEFSRELQEERKKLLSMEERKLSRKEAKRLAKPETIRGTQKRD